MTIQLHQVSAGQDLVLFLLYDLSYSSLCYLVSLNLQVKGLEWIVFKVFSISKSCEIYEKIL